jgi:hypothetical protein
MNKVACALILGLGILVASSIHAASNGTYRWTDSAGTVQYSDRPPEGIDAEFIQFAGGAKTASENAEDVTDEQSTTAEGERTLQVMPEKDPVLCEQAKGNLKALEAARIRITEPDGSKRILSEDEKTQQRDNAKKFIKIYC